MKIIYIIFLFLFILSCNTDESKINEFKDIYFDILMVREKFQDTAIANPKVREILKKYGYNDETFKEHSMELFSENPENFTKIIDSVKTKTERLLMEYGKEKLKKIDSAKAIK